MGHMYLTPVSHTSLLYVWQRRFFRVGNKNIDFIKKALTKLVGGGMINPSKLYYGGIGK